MLDVDAGLQIAQEQFRAGKFSVALWQAGEILRQDHQRAEAWHLAGLAAIQTGRREDAVRFLNRASDLDPSNLEFLSNLALAYQLSGDRLAAWQVLQAALAIDPKFPAANFRAGKLLILDGQSEKGLEYLQVALDGDFDPIATLTEIGIVLQSLGRADESIRALNVALELEPSLAIAYYYLGRFCQTGQFEFGPERVQHIRKLARDAETAGRELDAARLHFALGHHFESQSQYRSAFECFQSGNQIAAASLANRQDCSYRDRELLTSIFLNTDRKAWEAIRQSNPKETRRPIFVVGFPRSGTTLLEQILARHPKIETVGESPQLARLLQPALNSLLEGVSLSALADQLDWNAIARQYRAGMNNLAETTDYVIDKMPDNYLYAGFIWALFPDAIVIQCRRGVNDTLMSCFSQLFDADRLRLQTSSWDRLFQNYKTYQSLSSHWQTVFPAVFREVQYEQVVEHPERVVRNLLDSMNLEWNEGCLDPRKNRHPIQTASSVQANQTIYARSCDRWRNFAEFIPFPEVEK